MMIAEVVAEITCPCGLPIFRCIAPRCDRTVFDQGAGACRYCGVLQDGAHQPECPFYVPPAACC